MLAPIHLHDPARDDQYERVRAQIDAVLDGEDDWISALSTVACELSQAFAWFHWTGFYRVIAPQLLAVGPYQGGHGCLRIEFDRGVCGAAARTGHTQLVPDVALVPDHIACSSSSRSEIVVPIASGGEVVAVLDVDSNDLAAFDGRDQRHLESLCRMLGERYASMKTGRSRTNCDTEEST
jgi:GAF domain-containing protein